MSVEIHQYLDNSGGNNFTENTPRPPVGPGEDNELHSTGGNSNKSSSSHKSITSTKSAGSAGAATPRRLQKTSKPPLAAVAGNDGKSNAVNAELNEDSVAPLGFEPEGSVDEKAEFAESSTPSFARWAESLDYLLEDAEGCAEFQKFLTQENHVNLFEFYFAWKYLKELEGDQMKSIGVLIKTMYRTFIKGDKGKKMLNCIPVELRENVAKHVSAKQYSKTLFDPVRDLVVDIMKHEFYLPFLKSDIYHEYIRKLNEAPRDSANSSGSTSACAINNILPTVHEDSELDLNQMSNITDAPSDSSSAVTLSLTLKNVRMTERLRQDYKVKPEDQAGYYLQKSRDELPPHPYHSFSNSYIPISAIDSERQSLSSDCPTDDTHSVTDSSVDGYPQFNNKRSVHRYYKKMRHNAQRNPESHANNNLVPPKNQRSSKISNPAETNPREFARILTEKLQAVLDEWAQSDMVKHKLSNMSEDDCTDDSRSVLSSTTGNPANPISQFLVVMQARDHDAEAQNILDMHCKRIWEKSGQHTPAKSPPRSKSPDSHGQNKRIHTLPRNSAVSGVSTRQAIPNSYNNKAASSLLSKQGPSGYSLDSSYPLSTSVASYPRSNSQSRHGLATFSSMAEKQSILQHKPSPSAPDQYQRVVEWMSRNEAFSAMPNLVAESEKSSFRQRSSQRSGSTSASPKVPHRSKVHGKALGEVKRLQTDDRHSFKSKSSSSREGQKDRKTMSRSAGDTHGSGSSGAQTSIQKKRIPVPPQIKVAFFLPDEPIPYSVTVSGTEITLAKFKELITKKGNYRYFFKKKAAEEDFGTEVPYVLEEVTSDYAILPKWESKVVGHLKKGDS